MNDQKYPIKSFFQEKKIMIIINFISFLYLSLYSANAYKHSGNRLERNQCAARSRAGISMVARRPVVPHLPAYKFKPSHSDMKRFFMHNP